MTNAEKFKEIFGKSAKDVCDADNNEWWDEEYTPIDEDSLFDDGFVVFV